MLPQAILMPAMSRPANHAYGTSFVDDNCILSYPLAGAAAFDNSPSSPRPLDDDRSIASESTHDSFYQLSISVKAPSEVEEPKAADAPGHLEVVKIPSRSSSRARKEEASPLTPSSSAGMEGSDSSGLSGDADAADDLERRLEELAGRLSLLERIIRGMDDGTNYMRVFESTPSDRSSGHQTRDASFVFEGRIKLRDSSLSEGAWRPASRGGVGWASKKSLSLRRLLRSRSFRSRHERKSYFVEL